ncbi:hypothetical protein D3C78_1669000 [compost metagenome]
MLPEAPLGIVGNFEFRLIVMGDPVRVFIKIAFQIIFVELIAGIDNWFLSYFLFNYF